MFEDVGDVCLEVGVFCQQDWLAILLDRAEIACRVDSAVVQDAVVRECGAQGGKRYDEVEAREDSEVE